MRKDVALVVIAVFITILLTRAIFYREQPKIVVVDSNELFKEFVIGISNSIESDEQEEIEKKIKSHEQAVNLFNVEIVKIAKDNNLIILDKKYVIGGVEDQTPQAKELLKDLTRAVDEK